MRKIVLFLVAALIVSMVLCAGCTSTDPIVGQWKTNMGITEATYIFYDDGTGYVSVGLLSKSATSGFTWVNANGKYYISADNGGLTFGYVSDDSQTLTIEATEVFTFERKSYNVPAVRPHVTATQSYDTSPTQSYDTSPTQTPSSTAVGNVGTVMQYKNGDYHFDWTVNEVIHGAQARNILQSVYEYLDITPKSGNEYYMIKLSVTNKGNKKLRINRGYTFELYGDGSKIDNSYDELPVGYKELPSTDILPGATLSGWLTYIVPVGSDLRLYFNAETYGKYGDSGSYYVQI